MGEEMILICSFRFRMSIYRVEFSSPMLGFEEGKAMEEMHVVMGEESRVESCTLDGYEYLACSVAGQRGSLSISASAKRG